MITRQYKFPNITNDMYNKMSKWYKNHNNGNCANGYHGAIGGEITFEICPTSIGDFITIKCSCGSKLDFDEPI